MSRRALWWAALLLAGGALASRPAHAQDRTAGARKAAACAVCHGANGISTQPDAPNLAGQPEAYLAAQLRAYRDGTRRHEVMSLMAKNLSDADIADLAAHFAAYELSVKPRP